MRDVDLSNQRFFVSSWGLGTASRPACWSRLCAGTKKTRAAPWLQTTAMVGELLAATQGFWLQGPRGRKRNFVVTPSPIGLSLRACRAGRHPLQLSANSRRAVARREVMTARRMALCRTWRQTNPSLRGVLRGSSECVYGLNFWRAATPRVSWKSHWLLRRDGASPTNGLGIFLGHLRRPSGAVLGEGAFAQLLTGEASDHGLLRSLRVHLFSGGLACQLSGMWGRWSHLLGRASAAHGAYPWGVQ